MTEPRPDASPDPDAGREPAPGAASSASASSGPESSEPEPQQSPPGGAPGDDGVIGRVRRRTAAAAVVPLTLGVLLVLTGWFWPGWLKHQSGFFIGGLVVALVLLAAGALLRRAGWWESAALEAATWTRACVAGEVSPSCLLPGWSKAVCGTPVPLHSGRGSIPLVRRRRRFASWVLPLKTADGPLAAGYAAVVHARSDGAMPERGDRIQVLTLRPRGPILIGRLDDGAVFAADRWTAGTS